MMTTIFQLSVAQLYFAIFVLDTFSCYILLISFVQVLGLQHNTLVMNYRLIQFSALTRPMLASYRKVKGQRSTDTHLVEDEINDRQ